MQRDTTRVQKPVRLLNPHRRARLIAWALAMLNWVADALFGAHALGRKRLRQRGRYFSLHRLARVVCALAMFRALEIAGLRPRSRVLRNAAPPGFCRRTDPGAINRALIGARLRNAMKRGDLAQRIRFLSDALADIDAFARRYLVARALRGLTKLCAIVPIAPSSVALLGAPAPAPAGADSS
jgi:hypothetical protein